MVIATVAATNPTLWINTAVGVAVCWSRSTTFKHKTGQDPWGLPSWAWALIGLLLGLFAFIPIFIATRSSAVQKARQANQYRPYGQYQYGGYGAQPYPTTSGPQGPGWWLASDGWWYPPPQPYQPPVQPQQYRSN